MDDNGDMSGAIQLTVIKGARLSDSPDVKSPGPASVRGIEIRRDFEHVLGYHITKMNATTSVAEVHASGTFAVSSSDTISSLKEML